MQDLKVIKVEQGSLLLAAEDGERFRVALEDILRLRLRPTLPLSATHGTGGPKPTPRQIQADIRSGLTAEEVSSASGVPVEYIRRFEGPVLAERQFVVDSALRVSVHTAMDIDPISEITTFGSVIEERLAGLGAVDASWTSWKEAAGDWVVKLTFTVREVDHDARWSFDPKKAALAPLNGEATTLSQRGDVSGLLVPRLRAVDSDVRAADSSRFDSGAFTDEELRRGDPVGDRVSHAHVAASDLDFTPGTINRAPEEKPQTSSQTADLLEALRRRRGEREAAAFGEESDPLLPSGGGIHLVHVPLPDFDEDPGEGIFPTTPQPVAAHSRTPRKGRVTMPSWDEIVFGARPEDDPA